MLLDLSKPLAETVNQIAKTELEMSTDSVVERLQWGSTVWDGFGEG